LITQNIFNSAAHNKWAKIKDCCYWVGCR